MDYVFALISFAITLAAAVGAFVIGKKSGFHASDEEMMNLRRESQDLESKLVETLSENHRFASRGQIADLQEQAESFLAAVSDQRSRLETLSERLDQTRADVERREQEQQEMRALKEEDERAISQALANYTESSTESVGLEQKLAESLRSLDVMSSEIKMSADQQAVFTELSNALTSASSQLRDVIIDYQNAHERLSNLRERFSDLEKEYTKLVEQQLSA
jgi:DNA repair exonuclease SbcCD ATPase subunit